MSHDEDFRNNSRTTEDIAGQNTAVSILSEITSASLRLYDEKTQLDGKLDLFATLYGGHEACLLDFRYWNLFIHLKIIEKFLFLIKNGLQDDSSMSLLSATRHVFELNVWLWSLVDEPRNSLVFYYKLLQDKIEHLSNFRRKALQEVELFQKFEDEERLSTTTAISSAAARGGNDDDLRALGGKLRELSNELDRKARRKFCLYARQATTNGYGFQAHLISEKAIPVQDKEISEFMLRLQALEASLQPAQRSLAKMKWNWRDRAKKAGMEEQYNFLYSLTSKLLHGTPFSTVTPPELDAQERVVLLDYIYISMLDLLDIIKGIDIMSNVFFRHKSEPN